ncbi:MULTISPECIES: sulfite exporter TauE/SafE family protein [unclassified Beijerinckia]|uniref:sulfite exporter TauE/SafE family protein n=1 Tax=unclassified Beijerinckia TaxID=2638183 RepID=UPI000B842B66|nr:MULTISPECIES: sulfite exporter TauE/SafE family protein [unclassified Beijerinckia]
MILGMPVQDFAIMIAGMIVAGAITGLLAGVFGVGGGAVIVPVLYEIFRILGVADEVRMPLTIGTSLAIIIPTSIASFRSHKARGQVDMSVLRVWAVPVVLGTILGALAARWVPSGVFKIVFIVVAGLSAIRLLSGFPFRLGNDFPKGFLMRVYGFITGVLSALMGIGGGQISSMFMTLYNRPIHQAISTSAGMGVLIAIPGAIGYAIAGYDKPGLPPFAIGYVSLIGIVLLAPISVLTAPLGVKLAHAMSKRTLEISFGLFLLIVSARFVVSLVTG